MNFERVLQKVLWRLVTEGCVSYRRIKLSFRLRLLGKIRLQGQALLDNWTWGLSLVALTIGIHVTGVTFLVSVLHTFRVRLESRNLGLPRMIAS